MLSRDLKLKNNPENQAKINEEYENAVLSLVKGFERCFYLFIVYLVLSMTL